MPIDVNKSIDKTAEANEQESWIICGYASTPDMDFQGEIIEPEGIDIDYFIRYGWINYEHKQDAQYQIGVPTENCYVDIQKGLYVEARLIKDNQYAEQMWKLANDVKKSGINRNIGFSVEGKIESRDENDSRIITGLMVKNVALTTHPANPNATWDVLMKSWETGHGITPETQTNAGALRKEDLASAITVISGLYKLKSPKEVSDLLKSVGELLDATQRSNKEQAIVMLQLGRGISKDQAYSYLEGREELL